MLIDMPELGSMDARHAASLSGLAPITRQSGNWRGNSFIQGGRAQLRQTLYMPALVAIRFNPPLKTKYQALRKAGKPAKVAMVAVMPASCKCMERSQSVMARRTFEAPSVSPWTTTANSRPARWRG